MSLFRKKDLSAMLGLAFEDDLAKKLNEDIFETIYFAPFF